MNVRTEFINSLRVVVLLSKEGACCSFPPRSRRRGVVGSFPSLSTYRKHQSNSITVSVLSSDDRRVKFSFCCNFGIKQFSDVQMCYSFSAQIQEMNESTK